MDKAEPKPWKGLTQSELARLGAEMYHPPLNPDQQRKVGQISITEPKDSVK